MCELVSTLFVFFDQHAQWWTDSNWWLVGIAAITAGVICWQSWETKTAARAASDGVKVSKDAANAALLNAKAVINAERPWLLIKPSAITQPNALYPMTGRLGISFKATNVGRSPAEIIFSSAEWTTLLSGEKILDSTPFISEGIPVSEKWSNSEWISPGSSFELRSVSISANDGLELWKYLVEGTRTLFVMGFVRYRDAIAGEIHESRFCYWVPIRSGHIVMTGPAGYNKLT